MFISYMNKIVIQVFSVVLQSIWYVRDKIDGIVLHLQTSDSRVCRKYLGLRPAKD